VSHARDVARDTVNAITRKRTHVEQRLAGALEDALVKIAELEHVANGLGPRLVLPIVDPVNLVKAKYILQRRRELEPVVPPDFPDGAYDRLLAQREATDLLEELIDEVEQLRKAVLK
jgi:hypothetical protein